MRIDADAERAQPARRLDQPVGETSRHGSLTRQSTFTTARGVVSGSYAIEGPALTAFLNADANRQVTLLVARETRVGGQWQRRFEVRKLDGGYAVERWAGTVQKVTAFNRWSDAAWKQGTVSLR